MTLLSHPDKPLAQHVDEVQQAAEAILLRHSARVAKCLGDIVRDAVRYHDVGKAGREFQTYIQAPNQYRGDRKAKAHAPISLCWWLAHALDEEIDVAHAVSVAALVWKHHGDFPILPGNDGLDTFVENDREFLQNTIDAFPQDQCGDELGIQLSDVDLDEIDEWLEEECDPGPFVRVQPEPRTKARLAAQLAFSILLQSDRAFLALSDEHVRQFLKQSTPQLPDPSLVARYCQAKPKTPVSEQQTAVRERTVRNALGQPLSTVSLPTGMGKTLLGAQWILAEKQRSPKGKVVVVLPFLSVIDQTAKEYTSLLAGKGDLIQQAHSLAAIDYLEPDAQDDFSDAQEEIEERAQQNQAREFLAEIWDAPIVITTFDQFLYALFSHKKRHILKSHHLADACIVMDEIQAVPPKLWEPLSQALSSLAGDFNTRCLVMSATQPGFLTSAVEAVNDPESHFACRDRYQLELLQRKPMTLESICLDIEQKLAADWRDKRVMVVLNTRKSARQVRDFIAELGDERPVYFISADVVPHERLASIAEIKRNDPCIVVATQCVEAGVDIDLEVVVRDWSPLDSIIQVAGRCNRRGLCDRGTVQIVKLLSESGKAYAEMIYDHDLLTVTGEVFSGLDTVAEESVYPLICSYYARLLERKDKGDQYFQDWSKWHGHIPVRELLRGDGEKFEFVVASEAPQGEQSLRDAMGDTLAIRDRWQRRRAQKQIAPRIAGVTVSVWARKGMHPGDVADPVGFWWVLRSEYYETGKGFLHEQLPQDQGSLFL